VQVGRSVYIGAGACIRNGVVVREGALVGMNSTVIRDVPAGAVVAGSPARPVTERIKSR
jgi:acetyltransferase-like isoleucine patch superfamily enzyme